jgi:hypothetical protein
MTEKQKDCIVEIQELMMAISAVVKKYDLEDEFISCLAVGFIEIENSYLDEDGKERANMSLLSSISVTDEEELDDLLSYCVEAYRMDIEEEEKPNTNSIDYWINLSNGNDSVN